MTPGLLDRRDGPWLGAGLAAGVLAVAVYLVTNPYPAYGAGLYLRLAEALVANGYVPPPNVSGYTAAGVPFAYPPLQFYVLAGLLDLGVDPVTIARLLPGVGVLAALVPTYLLARDYTGSRPAGALAAAATALNPQLLQWHVSAGGVVRAFAFCYALLAVYAGYRAFEADSRRGALGAVALGALAFGATLLSHPTYTVFAGTSVLLLWLVRDRSTAGFARGTAIAVGGVALAAPWLGWVVATHGPDVLLGAAGTHGGLGGGTDTLDAGLSLALLPVVGGLYLRWRGDRFLLAWAAVALVLFAQARFVFAVGSVVLAAVAADLSGRLAFDTLEGTVAGVDRRSALAAACLLLGTVAGAGYFAHEATLDGDPSTPEFLDDESVAAMAWVQAETAPDATFVVLGDAAEWFPLLADRTILVGPWGVEWRGPTAYERQLRAYRQVSACATADCVERWFPADRSPTYVYVPRGGYTVRGHQHVAFGTLERSFAVSPAWDRAYANHGVVVYRAVGRDRPGSPGSLGPWLDEVRERDDERDQPAAEGERADPAVAASDAGGQQAERGGQREAVADERRRIPVDADDQRVEGQPREQAAGREDGHPTGRAVGGETVDQ
ncbi:glycosyltransferase family 39 protein [Salinirubellus salinus]|uniref:Glycosyltransferase family 39 protein n=1 Tax=Salinirubellus salinus TaxID=1364945 RepID=A0A9E7U7F2_9EURY|nr:glycosyltransferase family 39 protein [Salinirubellus salinus]UWM53521.1 glycosyltransferase family 39 protein [Salinirubellus salinus]